MILPDGDVREVVAVTGALNNQDFSEVNVMALRNNAEQVLMIAIEYAPDGSWKMSPESYPGTENAFYGLSVSGVGTQTLLDGWTRLNNKMALVWQEKNRANQLDDTIYYARLKVDQASDWRTLEKEFKKMVFLENLILQGAMPGQLLLRFNYAKSPFELTNQLDKVGWIWQTESGTLGTLKRKDFYENAL